MLLCLSWKLTSRQVGQVDKLLVIKSKKTEQQISLLLCFYDSIKEVLLFMPLFLLNQRLRVRRILGGISVITPLPTGEGQGGGAACLLVCFLVFTYFSYSAAHTHLFRLRWRRGRYPTLLVSSIARR